MLTVTLLTLLLIIWFLFTRDKKPNPPLPPGPPRLPIVGNLLSLGQELHFYSASLARIHGSLFSLRLGTKVRVIESSPKFAKELLNDNDVVFANCNVPAAGHASSHGGSDNVDPIWTAVTTAAEGMHPRDARPSYLGSLIWYPSKRSSTGCQARRLLGQFSCPNWGSNVRDGDERGHKDVMPLGREFREGVAEFTRLLGTPNLSDFFPVLAKLDLQGVVCVREMLGPATLEAVYELRRREVRRAIRQVTAVSGSPVKVGEEMFLTVMNVVTGMLWGSTVAEAEERESLGREFREAVAELTALLGTPNVSDFFPVLAKLDLQGVVRKMRKVAKKFDEVFERVINQRLRMEVGGDDKKDKDFLQVLLKMKDDYERNGGDNEVSFSMIHVKALLMDMVVGGTDTTSNTVEFTMAELMNKPAVLKKVQEELDTVVGKDTIVEEHHIYKLPYLQAVMKEALRLHPALPLLVPHCPSETCIIGGYTVPKGSRVFINVWAIHRDPDIWPNPLEFDPERFLNAKFDFSGNDFNYFPFGSGRRICAGIGMAERMVLFALASLLHSFEWKLPKGEELTLEEKFGIVLRKKIPLVLIPVPRLTNPALYE
ncbi:hypothetical protein KSS87_013037 [Heliosperma pusillum]|nr:hypothetical protein KSS87_013037 [Heliosperma pusillum]